jgi:hypothetical protein
MGVLSFGFFASRHSGDEDSVARMARELDAEKAGAGAGHQ